MSNTNDKDVTAAISSFLRQDDIDFSNWSLTPYKTAIIASPSNGKRGASLFLVESGVVVSFNFTYTTVEEAYQLLEEKISSLSS